MVKILQSMHAHKCKDFKFNTLIKNHPTKHVSILLINSWSEQYTLINEDGKCDLVTTCV